MLDYKSICGRVCDIAKQAGEFIARERKTFSFDRVEFKGAHDMVSYVDKEAEKIVVSGLRDVVPAAGFITEEDTAEYTGEEFKWIIDPLDGTTNFIHGLAPYCVSIALMRGEELVVGVVYEVVGQELFYAWKDSAAYLNGEEIRVSEVDKMVNSLIAIGFSYKVADEVESEMARFTLYQKNSDGIRRIGSATADLVYVACGRCDAFEQKGLSPWDVAAGAFIAERAGARVSDYSGGSDYVFGGEIVAANPRIYDEFVKIMDR